ncbi:MAG: FtsX-like permease family protein [Candidatus Thorarchaeota archaeon]
MNSQSTPPTIKSRASGSRWYVANYVGNSIQKHKTRFISLLVGIIIGVSLVASVFVWTDTNSQIETLEYFESNLYQYEVQQVYESPIDPQLIFNVKNWFAAQPVYQDSDVIYHSVGFLNGTNWNSTTPYLSFPYTRGIKDFQTFFVENSFLHRVAQQYDFDGVFELSPGECLVSTRVVEDANALLNQTISIGSYIDITTATIYDEPITLGDLDPLSITNLLVVGTYNITPSDTILYTSARGTFRQNYPGSIQERIFGWNDGIIMHFNQLNSSQRDALTANFLYPKLLVQLNPMKVTASGLESVPAIIRELKFKLEYQYPRRITVEGEDQVFLLEQSLLASQSRQTVAVIALPVILLSIFLTIFATNIFLYGRRSEVAILRARGASFHQLYAAFIVEFVITGIIALCVGMALSIFIGSLIAASEGFLQFNPVIFFQFLANLRLEPLTWIVALMACLLPPLIFTMIYVRSFLRAEIYPAMTGTAPPAEADFSITIIYAIAVVALLGFLIATVILLPATPLVAVMQFIYAITVWALFSDIGSRIVRHIIAGMTRGFQPVFGEITVLFEKSMRARRQRIVPLLLILTLTFSITIFAVVEAQTIQENAQMQVSYFIGGDLRIESSPVPQNYTSDILSIPGVISVTALLFTTGSIGPFSLTIYGIDAEAYYTNGNWDLSSMVGEPPFTILSRLQNTSNGIIFPRTIAERLGRRVGNSLAITVHQQGGGIAGDASFVIVGLGNSAPGLGYFDPDDPSRPPDPTDGFLFQTPQIFALINSHFLESLNMDNTRLMLASVADNADIKEVQLLANNLSFVSAVYSPMTFSLENAYPEGYLFNRGVVGLLSIGFLACLIISIIALTLFVGIIVTERRTEYAIMRAVGSTQWQITTIVIGEFIGLILTSFLVAVLLGFFFSWLLMAILLNLFPFPYVIPFQLGIPWVLLFGVLVVVLLGLSIGTYIPARRAGQTNVGKVLRNL